MGRIRSITDDALDARIEALRVPTRPGGRVRTFCTVAREAIEAGLEVIEARRRADEAPPASGPTNARAAA